MIVYKKMFYVLNYGFLVLSLNNVAMETCASILKWHRIVFRKDNSVHRIYPFDVL